MIPAGYMAKRVARKPEWLGVPRVLDVYSVSSCVNDDFADYINFWKHNGYWFFDSPDVIRSVAAENAISLDRLELFYYEVHGKEFDGESWKPFDAEPSFKTEVLVPSEKTLEGFDVVTFLCRNAPEHSPLSCNSLAREIHTNAHCLLETFESAEAALNGGAFRDAEPGPYRIFAVYSVDWAEGKRV